ncbi:MAG: class I SAM-dependent methyltransferase [candidate division Zixibacteria bacterium]|nr:class I SAM-dependent methyltransferase [candidate division Zixibacteria bacterium]
MDSEKLYDSLFSDKPDSNTLWDGQYKIPWNEPDFSKRMLQEHLSQEHNLASRKTEIIKTQVEWIHEKICDSKSRKLLDLGCGPGFYIKEFLSIGYDCCGIDFSPASIDFAYKKIGESARLIHGDIRSVDYGTDYNLAMMIYGEFNVFSPQESRMILKRAYDALAPGGRLLLEVHTYEAVERIGKAPNSWYKTETGLFSENPHVCLIESHWFNELKTTVQKFIVIDLTNGNVKSYHSTTKAWTDPEYKELLLNAGFNNVSFQSSWPAYNDDMFLITAEK